MNPQNLRYYEWRGFVAAAGAVGGGYRAYSPPAVPIVRFIKRAQDLGSALDDVESLLHLAEGGPDSYDAARELVSPVLRT